MSINFWIVAKSGFLFPVTYCEIAFVDNPNLIDKSFCERSNFL